MMEIRLAKDSEAPQITRLFNDVHNIDAGDWERIYPYWAVAVVDGKIIAALQLCMSLPVGRLEHLLVDQEVNKLTATKAAHALIKYGEYAMKKNGCSYVAGYVSVQN